MFIVEINGGLGNQMFQYCFISQLERIYPKTRVRANIIDRKHYELGCAFGLKLNECPRGEAARMADIYPSNVPMHTLMKPLSKIRAILFGHKTSSICQDDNTCFYSEYYHLNPLNGYYFQGTWANSEYLIGVENKIKEAFNFRGELTEINKRYIYEISHCNAVGIHVRRGDYVTLGLQTLGEDYYKSAVKYMCEKVSNPKFFVFSNDLDYCKKIFNGYKDFAYIEGNSGNQSFRDMQLMSACKHNIIANSTFSFWGAYLNSNPDKIVIAPNIGIGTIDFNTPFTCPDWIKINVQTA